MPHRRPVPSAVPLASVAAGPEPIWTDLTDITQPTFAGAAKEHNDNCSFDFNVDHYQTEGQCMIRKDARPKGFAPCRIPNALASGTRLISSEHRLGQSVTFARGTEDHPKRPSISAVPQHSLGTHGISGNNSVTKASTARRSEKACRNRLESALRDQFDTSFTGSLGLGCFGMKRRVNPNEDSPSQCPQPFFSNEQRGGIGLENIVPDRYCVPANLAAKQSSHRKIRRKPGPNERLYKDRYESQIENQIELYRLNHPLRPLKEYDSLASEQRREELDRVAALLSRLGVGDSMSDTRRSTQGSKEGKHSCQESKGEEDLSLRCESIDDSATTLGHTTIGPNDTTACSRTRLDQSSMVFSFDGGKEKQKQDERSLETKLKLAGKVNPSIYDQDSSRMYNPGIMRVDGSRVTCNADAGTLATKGAVGEAHPKYLFQSQTPLSKTEDKDSGVSYDLKIPLNMGQKGRAHLTSLNDRERGKGDEKRITGGDRSICDRAEDLSVSPVEIARSHGRDLCREGISSSTKFRSPLGQFSSDRKRLATSSGKRGLDLRRFKSNQQAIEDNDHDHFFAPPYDSFEQDSPIEHIGSPCHIDSMRSSIATPPLSLRGGTPSFLAVASQSPILKHNESDASITQADPLTKGAKANRPSSEKSSPSRARASPCQPRVLDSSDVRRQDIRFEDIGLSEMENHCGERLSMTFDDTVESIDNSVLPRLARDRVAKGREFDVQKAPVDIRLRDGESFRLDPLRCRRPIAARGGRRRRSISLDSSMRDRREKHSSQRARSESPPTLTFPDPLSAFDRRMAERLDVVADWIIKTDCVWRDKSRGRSEDGVRSSAIESTFNDNEEIGRGVFVSMVLTQIIAVTLKLLQTNPSRSEPGNNALDVGRKKELRGGSLVVLRSKEHIEIWERALRERSPFSVLNHANLTLSERKRSKTPAKCANAFDVILTTYDALKTKEIPFALDDMGRAKIMDNDKHNGWYSSRSQSRPVNCEHLSGLHKIRWNRIIFVDALGRQSYVNKLGTARARAGIALNSNSRFIFYVKEKGSTDHLEEALKESTKQLRAVASTLHMPEENAAEFVVAEAMVDLNDVREVEPMNDSHFEDGQRDESGDCSSYIMSPR